VGVAIIGSYLVLFIIFYANTVLSAPREKTASIYSKCVYLFRKMRLFIRGDGGRGHHRLVPRPLHRLLRQHGPSSSSLLLSSLELSDAQVYEP